MDKEKLFNQSVIPDYDFLFNGLNQKDKKKNNLIGKITVHSDGS